MEDWWHEDTRLIYRCVPVSFSPMTELLERALNEAARLPEKEQDALASLLFAEMESERRWNTAFEDSQPQLARLAAAALAEFRAGRTLPFNPERDLADH